MTPEELNRALAEAAGWKWVCPEAMSLHWWFSADGENQGHTLPDFANSIDAQHRWIDPLVEAKWGRFGDSCEPYDVGGEKGFEAAIVVRPMTPEEEFRFFRGEGPTRAHARAEALLAALQ